MPKDNSFSLPGFSGSKDGNDMINGLTATDIAAQLGITRQAVLQKTGIESYLIGYKANGGRPAAMYNPLCIQALWMHKAPTAVAERSRKGRSDVRKTRKESAEDWQTIVSRVKGLYLNSAQDNLRQACLEAVTQLRAEGLVIRRNVYKRLTCKNRDHDGYFISEFYGENWKKLRESKWRRKDFAIDSLTARYSWLEIFESAKWAGPGFGALRGWSIDIRKADVWARDERGEAGFPTAVYIRDALTGFPLWQEPIETETSTAVIRAFLNCAVQWGTLPDLVIALDNGKAMISERTQGVLAAALPRSAWDVAAKHPALFGKLGSPILLNLPNIPQSPIKASLERSFKQLKDEFDATRYPALYQGGNRSEAVQLNLSAMPVLPAKMLTTDGYFSELKKWLYGDYILKLRPDTFPTLKAKGIEPTYYHAFKYYGGFTPLNNLPQEGERIARLLYFATEKPIVVRAHYGYVEHTVNGEYHRWICGELDNRYYNQKVAVLPLPDYSHAILMYVGKADKPQYIGTATPGMIRHIDDIPVTRGKVRRDRNTVIESVRRAADNADAATWHNHHEPLITPVPAIGTTLQLPEGRATAGREPQALRAGEYIPELDSDTADFLNDLEKLVTD